MCKIDVARILETDIAKNTAIWIHRVIGTPVEDGIGLLFADALKEKRLRNAIRLQTETQKFKIENHKSIPLSFSYKLLDKATLEENDFMLSKWAKLLANSMDADYKGGIKKIHIDILDSLEPIDAKVLEVIAEQVKPINPFTLFEKMKENEISISIDTLTFLNLIKEDFDETEVPVLPNDWDDPTKAYVRSNNNGNYYLTVLGISFIAAVNRIVIN